MEDSLNFNDSMNCVTTKDWDRAYTVDKGRVCSMLNAIKDPIKLVGRCFAVMVLNHKQVRLFSSTIIDMCKKNLPEDFIKTLSHTDIFELKDFSNSVAYAPAQLIMQEKLIRDICRKQNEFNKELKRQSDKRVDKGVDIAIKEICNYSQTKCVMHSYPSWNSFGGRIGNYSHEWYNSNGNKMTDRVAENRLYDMGRLGGYVAVGHLNGGYSYDFGITYDSKDYYYRNPSIAIKECLSYSSDMSVYIYKIPKLTDKLLTQIKDSVVKNVLKITENELDKVIKMLYTL